jgi:Flp pilus assembly protein TadD
MSRSLLAACAALLATAAPALAQAPGPIETQQLSELTPWTVSALSRANGAFPPDLWRNTDPAFLVLIFDRLPAVYESPAVQDLARRVLLSGGEAPAGDATAAARKRFEVLGKMGAADELAIMAAGIASSLTDPAIAQYAAQAELARGRRAEACSRGRSAQAGETPSAFILRLRAYCAATGGDRAAADLALDIARQANAADPWYTSAVAAAGGAL